MRTRLLRLFLCQLSCIAAVNNGIHIAPGCGNDDKGKASMPGPLLPSPSHPRSPAVMRHHCQLSSMLSLSPSYHLDRRRKAATRPLTNKRTSRDSRARHINATPNPGKAPTANHRCRGAFSTDYGFGASGHLRFPAESFITCRFLCIHARDFPPSQVVFPKKEKKRKKRRACGP